MQTASAAAAVVVAEAAVVVTVATVVTVTAPAKALKRARRPICLVVPWLAQVPQVQLLPWPLWPVALP